MNCRCGSGQLPESCHGNLDDHSLRRSLLDRGRLSSAGELEVYRHFEPEEFRTTKQRVRARIVVATTPAGIIHYPVGLFRHNKFVRPMTIDGISYYEGKWVAISMMLTPTLRGFIYFEGERAPSSLWRTGIYDLEVEAYLDGDPFCSVFALDADGSKVCLYHHTTDETAGLIEASGKFRPSKWNYQGTTELATPHHAYFTSVPKLLDATDLIEVGMAPKGTMAGVVADDGTPLKHEVYRMEAHQRNYAIRVWVDCSLVAPNFLILHDPESNITPGAGGSFSWWEVFAPASFRVPIRPGGSLPLSRRGRRVFELKRTPNFVQTISFYAALGSDHKSLLRLWTEQPPGPGERISPADRGDLDPRWRAVSERSLGHLTAEYIANLFR